MKQLFIIMFIASIALGSASPIDTGMSINLLKNNNDDLSFHIIPGEEMSFEQILHFVKKQRTKFGDFSIEIIVQQEIRISDVLMIISGFTDEGLNSPSFYVQIGLDETKDGGGLVKLRSITLGDMIQKEVLSYRPPISEISSDDKLKYDVIEK